MRKFVIFAFFTLSPSLSSLSLSLSLSPSLPPSAHMLFRSGFSSSASFSFSFFIFLLSFFFFFLFFFFFFFFFFLYYYYYYKATRRPSRDTPCGARSHRALTPWAKSRHSPPHPPAACACSIAPWKSSPLSWRNATCMAWIVLHVCSRKLTCLILIIMDWRLETSWMHHMLG